MILAVASAALLRDQLARFDALLVGPGLGDSADLFLADLFATVELPPLVVDADGLNFLARQPHWPDLLPKPSILTPHPGEMARLVGEDIHEKDRVALARKKSAEWGHIVVLKGAYTVVATPDGRATIIPFAASQLAIAGSGDVLAGVIVSLLAQGVVPYDAARLGAYLHGMAGLEAAQYASGLIAREIADALPAARDRLTNQKLL